jgi:hypothetical protein
MNKFNDDEGRQLFHKTDTESALTYLRYKKQHTPPYLYKKQHITQYPYNKQPITQYFIRSNMFLVSL